MPVFLSCFVSGSSQSIAALFMCWGGIEFFSASWPFSRKHFIIGNPEVRTGRADIVQNLVGTDLRIESFDRGSHGEREAGDMLKRRGGGELGVFIKPF